MTHLVAALGWVDLGLMFHCLPHTAWAYWNLAEVPGKVCKMAEH